MGEDLRSWKVNIKDRVAGHGMSLPHYELPYDGWEMENPPSEVVDKCDFNKAIEALKYISKYCETTSACRADDALKELGLKD